MYHIDKIRPQEYGDLALLAKSVAWSETQEKGNVADQIEEKIARWWANDNFFQELVDTSFTD